MAHTLKLPAVTIRTVGAVTPLAQVGTFTLEPFVLPIIHQGETVGELAVSPRARGEPLHQRDLDLLRLIARQAGATVHAVQMTQELRRLRQQILISREEERRRIRRDLHDGLGPILAALAMQADTAQVLINSDPATAPQLMAAVTAQASEVVQEVRRLVYALLPPALDELGLVGALEQLSHQHSSATLQIAVQVPTPLPPLPAVIEVTLYRDHAELSPYCHPHVDHV